MHPIVSELLKYGDTAFDPPLPVDNQVTHSKQL